MNSMPPLVACCLQNFRFVVPAMYTKRRNLAALVCALLAVFEVHHPAVAFLCRTFESWFIHCSPGVGIYLCTRPTIPSLAWPLQNNSRFPVPATSNEGLLLQPWCVCTSYWQGRLCPPRHVRCRALSGFLVTRCAKQRDLVAARV